MEVPMRMTARLALAAALLVAPAAAFAHHGWTWTTGGNIDLTGIITKAALGNPHGLLTVDVEGEIWTVEVGQPWRNERAGLVDADLAPGKTVRFVGEPAADSTKKVLKAERIFIVGKEYDLYPERD
jgi:hypothetical protein